MDLKAATAAGVLVMNTPGGNAVSVAEHTLALLLTLLLELRRRGLKRGLATACIGGGQGIAAIVEAG